MKYTKLGKSGLSVPRICLGTNNFGKQVETSRAFSILEAAFDLGVNLIDSADIYTGGMSEEIIGEWARGRRGDLIISTKVGMEDPRDDPRHVGLSRENVEYQLDHSLKRLQTDYVDLYYVHQFDPDTPLSETLETLEKLVEENKIHHIACSNFSARQLSEALSVSEKKGLRSFVANQIPYNIFDRDVEEETLPYCGANSVGVLAYSPLGSGLLAGRYRRNSPPPPDSRASFRGKDFLDRLKVSENMGRVEELEEIARDANLSLPVLSVAWVLRGEGAAVSSAVVGASNPEQFRQAAVATEVILTQDTIDRINRV